MTDTICGARGVRSELSGDMGSLASPRAPLPWQPLYKTPGRLIELSRLNLTPLSLRPCLLLNFYYLGLLRAAYMSRNNGADGKESAWHFVRRRQQAVAHQRSKVQAMISTAEG